MPRRSTNIETSKRAGVGAKATVLTKYIRPHQPLPQGNTSHRSNVVLIDRYYNGKGREVYQFRFVEDDVNAPILHANGQWVRIEEEGHERDLFEEEGGPRGPQPGGGFIEPKTTWQNSKARALLYHDIKNGEVPLDARDENNQIIMKWQDIYMMRPEYSDYNPASFNRRLRDLRKIVRNCMNRAEDDQAAFDLFKANHPVSLHSKYGYIQWQGSDAQRLLKIDMGAGRHNEMKKSDLWLSRTEYHNEFPLKVFRDKIYQEIRTAKYLHTIKVKGVGKGK